MSDHEQQRAPRVSWGLKALLGMSLALNLVVVGIVAGGVVRQGGWSEKGHRMPALGSFGTPYMQALPRQNRREIMKAMRGQAVVEIPSRKERRAMFFEVLSSLRAVPFERSALETTIQRQSDTSVTIQTTAQKAWVDHVSAMSDNERMAYADAVEEVMHRRPKGRK